MRPQINTEIAITYLSSRKKQTLVAALGVMFGVSMFIFMQSLMKGTNDYFEQQSFNNIPHIRLYNESKVADTHLMNNFYNDKSVKILDNPKQIKENDGLTNPFGIIEMLKKNPEVVNITPQVTANVFYISGSVQVNGIINGVNMDQESKMFDLQSNMVAGDLHDVDKVNNGIMVGKGIADKLSLHIGDNVTVRSATGNSMIMRVVAIFSTTVLQTDISKSYANIAQVQNLLGRDRSYVTDIKVNVRDYMGAPYIAREMEKLTGYKAEDWVEANQNLQAAFKIRAIILNSVIGVILLVAGFGIYNILNMTIYEKIKEIAILKATGFSGRSVTSIFLQQAIYIGIMGAVIGLMIGFGLTYIASKIYIGAGTLKYLPMSFYIPHYIEAVCFALLTTLAAGYFPARKAARVDPVSIIRG